MKKLLSSLLASSFLLSNLSLSFAIETTQTNPQEEIPQQISTETLSAGSCGDNATYSFDSATGTLTISGTGAMTDYDGTIFKAPVYTPWKDYREEIKSVVISHGITSIGSESFMNCSSLTYVDIPDSVTNIGFTAFVRCSALTSLTIPDSVVTIGRRAFDSCTSLTSMEFPDSVTTLGGALFQSCDALTSVTLPNSLTSIEDFLFSGCSALSSLNIPSSVTSIGELAFQTCTSLTSVNLPDSLISIGENAFRGCSALTSITLPKYLNHVNNNAFTSCTALSSVEILNPITRIDTNVFWECDALTTVHYGGTEADRENMVIDTEYDGNNTLLNATWIYEGSSITQQLDAIKSQLPYTGDISQMNLTAEHALAMAEEIEAFFADTTNRNFDSNIVYATLFDLGTGVPGMIEVKFHENTHGYFTSDYNAFYWNPNTAKIEEIPKVGENMGINFTSYGAEIWTGDAFETILYPSLAAQYKTVSGIPEMVRSELRYLQGDSIPAEDLESKVQEIMDLYNLGPVTMNWNYIEPYSFPFGNEGHYWDFLVLNGEVVDIDTVDYLAGEMWDLSGYDIAVEGTYYFDYSPLPNYYKDGITVANLLREYAEISQGRFTFPDFFGNNDVTDLFSSLNLAGTMLECYQVTDNFYYVIMEENGVEKGYLICAVKENGEVVYKIVHESTEILAEDALVTEGNHYAFDSNINIEFDALKDFTKQEDYVSYFSKALQNITGIQLNDQGKSALALSMQDSIVNFATYVKNLSSETGEIHQAEVAPLVEKSNSLYQDFLELLRNEQAELNKEIEQTVRVVLQGLDEKNWTIYLNPDLIGELEGNHLQVFLSSGQQGVEISADDLEASLTAHNGLFINVQETGSEQYAISFADGEGNYIEKLENAVKIFLPTSNEFSTVLLEYAQGTENWGGQYNSSTNTIQFSTIHSGTYLIVDNSVEIHDVSDEYLSMVQFMVSKGFFTVDDSGNFNPYGTMSRNDFTKTIVSMFFALDHDLKSSFPDVYEDSPYYSYIASGEARDIVAGYDDGFFYGDTILTEEMAFASIAQTLVDKKGYIYPDDNSFYLNSVSGGSSCSDWAESGIALSVRDSIILPSESINPTGEIARQDAAAYLYRLFMLLEEKQQINFELVEEISLSEEKTDDKDEDKDKTLLYAAVGALALTGLSLSQKGKKNEEKEV